jgi:hypothetical protein
MLVLGQTLPPKPLFHVRCRWREQSLNGAAAFPRHEQQAKDATSRAVSAAAVQHLFVVTLVLSSRPSSSAPCCASCTTSRKEASTATTRAPPPNAAVKQRLQNCQHLPLGKK